MQLDGIHHITCVTADAARNLDFYTRVLGLRLVKKTVNQDDPGVYHLFYADEAGSPGADITFFEFPGAWQGSAGAGMVHTIVWRVSSADAVAFWASRLRAEGVEVAERDDSVAFRDPDGLNHELVVSRADDERLVATHAEIDPAFALEGFDGVRAYAVEPEASSSVLAGILGFEATPDPDVWRLAGPTRSGLYASDAAPAAPGRSGPGTVHHVAFTTQVADQQAWHERLSDAGANPSSVIDRYWFRSIYFREPSGVLFELATNGPGFTADEDLSVLGQKLTLPPSFEPMREQIEARLAPLPDPRG